MKQFSLFTCLLWVVSCSSTPAKPSTKAPAVTPVDSPATFAEQCREGLNKAKNLLPEIEAFEGPRTLENTLVPFNELLSNLSLSGGLAGLMSSVHPDKGVRDEADACEQDIDKFSTALSMNRNIYNAFAAIDVSKLDANAKRFVKNTLRDFRRAGVDKDEQTRKRLKEIDEELTKLGQDFGKAIREDVRFIEVDNAEALKGLPADFIAAHKPGENGKIRITTDYPDYVPFIQYAENGDLRRKLYIEFKSRGTGNEARLKQIFTLRAEKATLLGYDNWANYVTETKMIGSAQNAKNFITKVSGLAQKRANADYQELVKRKSEDVKGAKSVEDYEKSFYENLVKKEDYDFNPLEARKYFNYTDVENGLLAITAKVYNLEYKKSKAPVWHQDVKAFEVFQDGKQLGRVYLDMHPRDGKYKHAAQFPFRTGVKGKVLPEGVLVCNFPNPREGENGIALMEHDDVVTMFHEFGHLMHHIIGGHQEWIEQSGVATEWDFVEAPSQMFEEWAWNYDTLKTFAKDPKTGNVIPEDLVARMTQASKFGLGLQTVQQMFYASISLDFHTANPKTLNMLETMKKLQAALTPFAYVEGTKFYESFGHLNGYSAIYYTYMWSLVIAKDLLTPFKEHGLMNTKWTHAYRDKVLAAGGTKDAAVLVKDFLGREYAFDAFAGYLNGK